METVTLNLSFERSPGKCRITIEDGIISRLPDRAFSRATSIAIISDNVVSKLYASGVKNRLSKFAKTSVITFSHGESSKSLDTCSIIMKRMNDLGLDRKSVAVALGGGVVGDMVGFCASIFKRGIIYVQIPTTLLAQVDSSIGGKTGVDTDWGKNQLGSFYQPREVFIDPSVLRTLPQSEVINGLGEIIKSGIIGDMRLFESVEKMKSPTIDALKPLIAQTVKLKAKVVGEDEREVNLRSILNYGHTVGHAIEAQSKFKLSHGRCVILGMFAEGWIASKLGIFCEPDLQRQNAVLRKVIGKYISAGKLNAKEITGFALRDKKSVASMVRMALPERIGKMHKTRSGSFLVSVSRELFAGSLKELVREI